MTLEEARLNNGWSLEEASRIYGLDAETIIEAETSTKNPNYFAINLMLSVLELDYEDIIL